MSWRKSILPIIFIIILLQGSTLQVRADQWDNILAANKITIGMDTTFAPFQWINNSVVVGYEVDLSARIAELLGINVEIITTPWTSIIPDLQNGNFDIIMSAMTITAARQSQIDFTLPYFYDGLGILVQSGNPLNITNFRDANNSTVKVGYIASTNAALWVSTNLFNAVPTSYTSSTLMYQAFNNGNIDVLVSEWYLLGYEITTGNLNGKIVDYGFNDLTQFGIGVRKFETRLLNNLNEAISTMIFDGTYANITETWFNVSGLRAGFLINDTIVTSTIFETSIVYEISTTEIGTGTRTETTFTTSTVMATSQIVETSYDVSTSTIIESKAEVTSPVTLWAIFAIGIWTYSIRKRRQIR